MKFKNISDSGKELGFNDVFIYQNYSDILSRKECSVDNGILNNVSLPIISSNMNAVSGKRMCETLSRYGGLGILPQDMSFETKLSIAQHILGSDIEWDTPLTVTPQDSVGIALDLINKKNHGCVVLVDENKNPLGYYTESDLHKNDRFVHLKDITFRSSNKASFIAKNLGDKISFKKIVDQKISENIDFIGFENLYEYLILQGEDNAFIYNFDGDLLVFKGIINKKDIIRRRFFNEEKNFLNKNVESFLSRKLTLGIAIGMNQCFDEKEIDHIKTFYETGVNIFIIDTAHGFQEKMIQATKKIRSLPFGKELTIIAGNVCTKEATKALIEAGANGVKVGIGPGAMCTTRMMTAVGRPQFSAIVACSEEANKLGGFTIADGGIKYTRDFCLALAAGAKFVMLGTMLSGTKESVGEVKYDEKGAMYKENYGMASSKAVLGRNKTLSFYDIALRNIFNEGISTSRIYLRDGLSTVGDVCEKLISGLKSSMTYVGAHNLEEYQEKAIIGVQTQSGYNEGTPHGNLVK